MPTYLHFPDIVGDWPWPRAVNPHTEACGKELKEWSQQFNFFPPETQTALAEVALSLASFAYPMFTYAQFRVAANMYYVTVIFDDYTDRMDAEQIQAWVNIITNILTTSSFEAQDTELSEMFGRLVQTFWADAVQTMTPSARQYFTDEFESYARAVVVQAYERDCFTLPREEAYMDVRRRDSGVGPSFALILIGEDFAPGTLDSDLLASLRSCASDMIVLANDMYSYNVEQSRGDTHNIVSVLMLQYNITVDEAIERISKKYDKLAQSFLRICGALVSAKSETVVDGAVKRYIDGLGNWIRANECFSFESERYFGKSGLKVQQERMVELLPRIH
ncbi:terpenoid synthase [Marasmius fiardii PR-910]|nr:terpenoid synthase [Marasmius fiardii PR-910]